MNEKEEILIQFLKKLSDNVFVKSTNSISMVEENLNPTVRDMEAVVAVSGEWDREDLKEILNDIFLAGQKQERERIEKLIERLEHDWSASGSEDIAFLEALESIKKSFISH